MAKVIYTLLKQDHDQIKPILKELMAGKQDKLEMMATELKAHSKAEEKAFYKPLEAKSEAKDLIAEGYKEHKEVDRLSKALLRQKDNKEKFAETSKLLQEAVLHHIREEEGEVFAKSREVFSQAEAKSMGEEFEKQKERMLAKA